MSGDPVAARLPHAILTKMVTFHGWKRFEMNSTMKFHGITEATFPSIMRRSLVILCKGRFVSAAQKKKFLIFSFFDFCVVLIFEFLGFFIISF